MFRIIPLIHLCEVTIPPAPQPTPPRPRTAPPTHDPASHGTDIAVSRCTALSSIPHISEAKRRQFVLVCLVVWAAVLGTGHGFAGLVHVVGELFFFGLLAL